MFHGILPVWIQRRCEAPYIDAIRYIATKHFPRFFARSYLQAVPGLAFVRKDYQLRSCWRMMPAVDVGTPSGEGAWNKDHASDKQGALRSKSHGGPVFTRQTTDGGDYDAR